jgi:hypothetical protein
LRVFLKVALKPDGPSGERRYLRPERPKVKPGRREP